MAYIKLPLKFEFVLFIKYIALPKPKAMNYDIITASISIFFIIVNIMN